MEETNKIEVVFTSAEIQLYRIIEQLCAKKNISTSDYIKDVIKKDLAWGRLNRRRKE